MKDLSSQMDMYRKTLDRCTVSDEKAQEILDGIVARKNKAQNNEPEQNKKTIRRYVSAAVAACAALAIIIAGVQISRHGSLPGLSPVPIVDQSQSSQPAASEQSQPVESSALETPSGTSPIDKTESKTPAVVVPSTPNGKFYWNDVRSGGDTLMYKDPNATGRDVSFEEFCDSLGYDPRPKYVPQGFEDTTSNKWPFYFNPDGSPTDYYSFYPLVYVKGQDRIVIRISVAEVYADNDVPMNNQELQKSSFDGFEAILMKNNPSPAEIRADQSHGEKSLDLSAVFQIHENSYYAYTLGDVPAEEFLKVLQSLY